MAQPEKGKMIHLYLKEPLLLSLERFVYKRKLHCMRESCKLQIIFHTSGPLSHTKSLNRNFSILQYCNLQRKTTYFFSVFAIALIKDHAFFENFKNICCLEKKHLDSSFVLSSLLKHWLPENLKRLSFCESRTTAQCKEKKSKLQLLELKGKHFPCLEQEKR